MTRKSLSLSNRKNFRKKYYWEIPFVFSEPQEEENNNSGATDWLP